MKTLVRFIVPLLIGALAACTDPNAGPVTVTPKSVTVKAGEKTTFSATIEDAKDPRVLWSVEGGDSRGTITSAGVYTAPTEAGTYTVVATNAVDTSKKDTATVKVEAVEAPTVSVKVTPETATLEQGATVALAAEVTGTPVTAVSWSVEGGDLHGTVTSSGVYTAPNQAGTFTVVATSVVDTTKTATATITVKPKTIPEVVVKVTPGTVTLDQGATATLTAEVTGTSVTAVTWAVQGGDANGTVTSTGVYTAPKVPGTYTVVATSVADDTKKDSATITVPVAGTVSYVDPAGPGWRLVKNTAESSGNTLVLDLVGPEGQSGRGVDLTLALDAARAGWATLGGTDYVANRAFTLGNAPHLFKGAVKANTLSVGVFQKGAPAQAYTGALVSVALTVKTTETTPAGTVVPLAVLKAHALPATGSLQSIDVAVGTITTAK